MKRYSMTSGSSIPYEDSKGLWCKYSDVKRLLDSRSKPKDIADMTIDELLIMLNDIDKKKSVLIDKIYPVQPMTPPKGTIFFLQYTGLDNKPHPISLDQSTGNVSRNHLKNTKNVSKTSKRNNKTNKRRSEAT